MTGQEADVILCVLMHAPSFWNDIADVLVILLQTRFLIGCIGITIKDFCTPGAGRILFNVLGILNQEFQLCFGIN